MTLFTCFTYSPNIMKAIIICHILYCIDTQELLLLCLASATFINFNICNFTFNHYQYSNAIIIITIQQLQQLLSVQVAILHFLYWLFYSNSNARIRHVSEVLKLVGKLQLYPKNTRSLSKNCINMRISDQNTVKAFISLKWQSKCGLFDKTINLTLKNYFHQFKIDI